MVILDQALWADRAAIMESIMRASASAGKFTRTYLALPKTVASVTDARLFQDRGIGLFTYDHRNIEEALPARYFETTNPVQHQVIKGSDSQLENELRQLRDEFSVLEQTVQQLREELASSRAAPAIKGPVETFTPRSRPPDLQVLSALPAFFAGNPWVEVLSRRGRDETPIVS